MSELQARSARRLAILTISDAGSRGERQDTSGPAISEFMGQLGYTEVVRELVPDEHAKIAEQLMSWCDGGEVDVILTTGGTGLSLRDVTPEATRSVIEYEVPGFPEAVRAGTADKTRMAMLSRAVAGMRAGCLVINLPGSPNGVRQALEVIGPVIGHAIDIARGRDSHGSEHDGHSGHTDHSGHTTH